MPSAKYFRLMVGDTKKTALELSAVHLYNDNTRVDQNATITSGFDLSGAELGIVKTDTPVDSSKIDIDLKIKRKTSLYLIWTFAADVNVNAFKIGSGSSESSFLDKFSLQYSDDGLTFKNFINIALDKKLYYPGPWQLTDLKPVGQCYPFALSKADQLVNNCTAGDVSLHDNYSFRSLVSEPKPRNVTWIGASTTGLAVPFPGTFQSGKYYFEVCCATKNLYAPTSAYNRFVLGFFKDPNERFTDYRLSDSKGASFCIHHPSCTSTDAPFTFAGNYDYSDEIAWKEFKAPGVQHGLAIDFDTRTIKIVNPTYAQKPPGVYDMTKCNFATATTLGEKLKLAIILPSSYGATIFNDGVYMNFGQDPFVNQPPAGFQAGFGPRWREVPDSFTMFQFKPSLFNADVSADYVAAGDTFEYSAPVFDMISAFENINGGYYIKGSITRVPNIENKRFLTSLFSHEAKQIVATCIASDTGIYEFYGIKYGLYTVLSVDIRDNTVSETIGPVYPKEIV